MAVPQNTDSVPTYVVYRDTQAGEPFDPTSPLLFFPPKGSDELFDALRLAFPNVKTHSERMRDAMIQYLLEERQQEEQLASPAVTMDTAPTAWPSISSDSNSTWSTPELLNFPTPAASFSNSPQLAPELTRQASIATSSQPSPLGPSLDAMTGVFCLSTSSQPKQRIRRKMTDAEKAEYRKRRIVKACDKCAKRKRKCPHNQAEMANVPNKPTSRAAKSKSATPPSSMQHAQSQQMDPSMALDSLASTFDPSEFIAFDDFNMFDDSYPDVDMSDMINWSNNELFTPDVSPLQRDWSYGSQTDDFTLLDPRVTLNNSHSIPGHTLGDTLYDHNSRGEQQSLDNLERFANFDDIHHFPGAGGLELQGNRHDSLQQQQHNIGGGYNGGNGMLWEHLRTGQPEPQPEKPVPTHTAHVHDAESGDINGLSHVIARPQDPCRQQSLPQLVLRLTGTVKATRALNRLLSNRADQTSSTTMDRIVNALRDRDILIAPHLQQQQHTSRSVSNIPAHLQRALFQESPLEDVQKRASAQEDEANAASSVRLRDLRSTRGRKDALSLLGESSESQTSTSASVSRGSLKRSAAASPGWPQQQQQPLAEPSGLQSPVRSTLPGRPQPSLGEGIPEDANPASELYMARRRISPRLHRYTDVNSSASVNAGIPGTDELYINCGTKATTPTAQSVSRATDAVRVATRSSTHGLPGTSQTNAILAEIPSTNGGAYPRLEAPDTAVHTRSRNPTASGFSGDTDQHHGAGSTLAAASSTAQAVASGLAGHEERLTDHKRYRDHHGRSSSSSSSSMLFLIAVTCVAFYICTAGLTLAPSMALLALVSVKEDDVQQTLFARCSTKNSSWLSTYATMQLGSIGSSSRGRGNEKVHGDSTPLKGLRLRSSFASPSTPLAFAVGA